MKIREKDIGRDKHQSKEILCEGIERNRAEVAEMMRQREKERY